MTGRPKLAIGQHGDIWVRPNGRGGFQARVYVRDRDGRTREATASADTRSAAKRALERKLQGRQPASATGLTSSMSIEQACDFWLLHRRRTGLARKKGDLKAQTLGAYEGAIRLLIVPSIGGVRVSEVTVGLLDAILADLDETGLSTAQARTVLGQVLQLAVRHGAIEVNPMTSVAPLRREEQEVEALDVAEAQLLRHLVDPATRRRPGFRGPSNDLRDTVDGLLGTGCRIGELLAAQWTHLDTTASTLEISGTLVEPRRPYVKELHRQESTKSKTSRVLLLPDVLVERLEERRRRTPYGDALDPIFASNSGTWIWPSNIRTRLRQALEGNELQGTTPHTLRRTVSTLVAHSDGGGLDAARDQLGHRHPGITGQSYVAPRLIAPDLRSILGQLLT